MTESLTPRPALDLEPCPFCGAPARSHTFWTESLFSHDQAENLQIGCSGDCDVFMSGEQQDDVRAAWNTRAQLQAAPERPRGEDEAAEAKSHVVAMPQPTEDQRAFLAPLLKRKSFDPGVVIGGPKPHAAIPKTDPREDAVIAGLHSWLEWDGLAADTYREGAQHVLAALSPPAEAGEQEDNSLRELRIGPKPDREPVRINLRDLGFVGYVSEAARAEIDEIARRQMAGLINPHPWTFRGLWPDGLGDGPQRAAVAVAEANALRENEAAKRNALLTADRVIAALHADTDPGSRANLSSDEPITEAGVGGGETLQALRDEVASLRQRLFGQRRVAGSSHSTACSIWGDNGLGQTRENFPEPLPCNCGALINHAGTQPAAPSSEAPPIGSAGEAEVVLSAQDEPLNLDPTKGQSPNDGAVGDWVLVPRESLLAILKHAATPTQEVSREDLAEIVADAINRFKDAVISGNHDVWAGTGSQSVVNATDAILALLSRKGSGQ